MLLRWLKYKTRRQALGDGNKSTCIQHAPVLLLKKYNDQHDILKQHTTLVFLSAGQRDTLYDGQDRFVKRLHSQ